MQTRPAAGSALSTQSDAWARPKEWPASRSNSGELPTAPADADPPGADDTIAKAEPYIFLGAAFALALAFTGLAGAASRWKG